MSAILVKQPGMLTTIQDLGRWGFAHIGMPVAGVMDDYAARVGNLLLGNAEDAPVLEITLTGPVLVFAESTYFVITGGDLQPQLNTQPLQSWRVYRAEPGDTLSFAGILQGCRAYLAVAGGFIGQRVMSSASTYLRGKLGGYAGRALRTGDTLNTASSAEYIVPEGLTLPAEYYPHYRESLRVVLGPQDDAFTPKGVATFLSAEYTVTPDADRMGYRLDGPAIEHKGRADIISDGIALGAVQVPAHGTPIIMLADHQTTGGYPKIANVITVDIPSIAQKKPGDTIKFEAVSIETAQHLYREREEMFAQIRRWASHQTAHPAQPISHYTITVNGQRYEVSVQELC
ncbi:5-oxoprolinase/urea amidolyase family protein [candidate division KSB3 bacterium]|uniref:5-oxoprolinase/urea amidolyase family protein n=1 Tax=candidate division KSB3 bacterium TaxID=2044937 RepID=A0A9D5JXT8_9BACT|nr:5-oxoprolinase/urea amidolyase family protein [candidate division KSB3 bacterium]MBD3326228.1 5-oxoprolinase/urea amidolyase family protein [candidate division KSB3 bacterium]